MVGIPMYCRCTHRYTPGGNRANRHMMSMTPLAAPNPTALKPYMQLLNLLTKLDNRMGRCLKASVRRRAHVSDGVGALFTRCWKAESASLMAVSASPRK